MYNVIIIDAQKRITLSSTHTTRQEAAFAADWLDDDINPSNKIAIVTDEELKLLAK